MINVTLFYYFPCVDSRDFMFGFIATSCVQCPIFYWRRHRKFNCIKSNIIIDIMNLTLWNIQYNIPLKEHIWKMTDLLFKSIMSHKRHLFWFKMSKKRECPRLVDSRIFWGIWTVPCRSSATMTQIMGPHFRQPPTYYLKRHLTNLIVGWKHCKRKSMWWRCGLQRKGWSGSLLWNSPWYSTCGVALLWKQYSQYIYIFLFNPGGLFQTPTQQCWVQVNVTVCCVIKKDPGAILHHRSKVSKPWMFGFRIFMWSFLKGKLKILTCANINSLKRIPCYITQKNFSASVQKKVIQRTDLLSALCSVLRKPNINRTITALKSVCGEN